MLSSVANIARILRSFHLACPELSLTELSRSLDIPKTTMLKLLHTMRAEGFLEKDLIRESIVRANERCR